VSRSPLKAFRQRLISPMWVGLEELISTCSTSIETLAVGLVAACPFSFVIGTFYRNVYRAISCVSCIICLFKVCFVRGCCTYKVNAKTEIVFRLVLPPRSFRDVRHQMYLETRSISTLRDLLIYIEPKLEPPTQCTVTDFSYFPTIGRVARDIDARMSEAKPKPMQRATRRPDLAVDAGVIFQDGYVLLLVPDRRRCQARRRGSQKAGRIQGGERSTCLLSGLL
jgi:hypothetical protein